MIPVLWHGGGGNWDAAFPRYILDQSGPCDHLETLDAAPELPQSSAVICIPGRHSWEQYGKFNWAAGHFDRVIFLIYGDEEGLFHAEALEHPDKKVWYFMPPYNPKQQGIDRVAVNGWPTGCREILAQQKQSVDVRDLDWSFLGQVTHIRRTMCADAAVHLPGGLFLGTPGFTQGRERPEYYHTMLRSKITLCPSGPQTPDSFRAAEALEAGCVPILDDLTPNPAYPQGYWEYAFGSKFLPFPIVTDWTDLRMEIQRILWNYQYFYPKCIQFWAEYKMKLISWMREDVRR